MDHEEPALNLSDVVHDHTIDDDDIDDSSIPEHISQSHHLPATSSLSPAHKHYHNSDLPPVNHQPLPVDILERELAALLNQDASDATAALLNAAAQQQAGVGLPSNSVIQPDDTTSIPGLEGLSITTLAAMLSAAHAQAELAAKNSDFAHQRADILPQKESQNTRTAPAFHSLTATESSHFHKPLRRRDRSSQSPDKSDYLYSDGHSDSDAESSTPTLMSRSPVDPGPPMTSSSLQEDFSDLNDILTQLSHFETDQDQSHDHGHPSPDTSPVVSRAHGSSQPASASLPHFPSPNRHPDPQPIASTSTVTQQTKATQKKGKGNTPSASQAKKPPVDKPPSIPSHICEQPGCQKSFTRRSDLARHMRIHTGERPFVCEYADCGKTFIQRSALHVHARVHTGEKPHCCEYPGCNKTFSDSSSLARHRRTHTGKRPYKCDNDACTKTFTRRTTLNQHMKMSHNPDWSPDPAVRYDFKTKRRRVAEESDDEDDQTLEDSVRTISAIFHAGGASLNGPPGTVTSEQEEPLELRVASISAEIAAAIAQAHARSYEEEDEDDEVDELADDSGDELNSRDTIGPTTSGIRGRGGNQRTGGRDGSDREDEDGERSLHLRGAEGELVAAGEKRKR